MALQVVIKFLIEPIKTHEMQYKCDERKDRYLCGQNGANVPVVQITDKLCRSGQLKVACVCDTPRKDSKYNLHPNTLIDYRCIDAVNVCDEYGVATYKFDNKASTCRIELSGLCIRRCRVNDVDEIRANWLANKKNKFDPFDVGYGGYNEKIDFQRVRLCCQAIFDDDKKSEVIVSNVIFSGFADIKIENWNDQDEFSIAGGSKLYVYIRRLTPDQRGIYARFSDKNGWQVDNVKPIYNHHDYAFIFEVPPYFDNSIKEQVNCVFQLYTKDKEYMSENMSFSYVVKEKIIKRQYSNEIDNNNESVQQNFFCCNCKRKKNSHLVEASSTCDAQLDKQLKSFIDNVNENSFNSETSVESMKIENRAENSDD